MRVLFLAPEPFYEERGTPIAVDLALRVLSQRGDLIDLVTYHQGAPRSYPNVTVHRIRPFRSLNGIRPGFSWKKVACDLMMAGVVAQLMRRTRYDLVHAVEESVFFAWLLRVLFRIPYLYDMDSSLSQQIREKHALAAPMVPMLTWLERQAVRKAEVVVPVCDALAALIAGYGPRRVVLLRDVSLLKEVPADAAEDLRARFGLRGVVFMYVGNLEAYQGIDLLLEGFARLDHDAMACDLVIVGGERADIDAYRDRCGALNIGHRVHFAGPRPVDHLAAYLAQADVLVSPRIAGSNTPMKVYSYLHSGRAVLATDLPTHTQVMTPAVARLAAPTPEAFARAMQELAADLDLRARLGGAARVLIEEQYSLAAFRAQLLGLYDSLSAPLASPGREGLSQ